MEVFVALDVLRLVAILKRMQNFSFSESCKSSNIFHSPLGTINLSPIDEEHFITPKLSSDLTKLVSSILKNITLISVDVSLRTAIDRERSVSSKFCLNPRRTADGDGTGDPKYP